MRSKRENINIKGGTDRSVIVTGRRNNVIILKLAHELLQKRTSVILSMVALLVLGAAAIGTAVIFTTRDPTVDQKPQSKDDSIDDLLAEAPAPGAQVHERPQASGTETFKVRSRVNTGINVKEGDQITISAKGEARFGNVVGVGGPDGIRNSLFQHYNYLRDAPHGALLARVSSPSEDGDWILIGKGRRFVAPNSGVLELWLNDKNAEDNQGHFAATVAISRKLVLVR